MGEGGVIIFWRTTILVDEFGTREILVDVVDRRAEKRVAPHAELSGAHNRRDEHENAGDERGIVHRLSLGVQLFPRASRLRQLVHDVVVQQVDLETAQVMIVMTAVVSSLDFEVFENLNEIK